MSWFSVASCGRTASAEDGFTPLFDGKTLAGWQGKQKLWSVVDGTLVGSTMPDGIRSNTFLVSERQYKNFTLKLDFKFTGGNSGIQFRSLRVEDPKNYVIQGYQADLGAGYHGSLHDEKRRGMLKKSRLDWVQRFLKENDWNTYEIHAIGNRITLKINGLITAKYTEEDDAISNEGYIALQLHSGKGMEIAFRDIRIRPIVPQRVLFTTHAAGFPHSSRPVARQILKKIARDSGYFEAVTTDDVNLINPAGLKDFDAVGFFTTGALDKFPLSRENREFFIEWVKSGKGFFGTHSATDTYNDWQPYWEMIGGTFAGHPWFANSPPVTIDVEDPSHPSVRHLTDGWVIQDEIYQFKNYSRERIHVVLSLNPNEHAKGTVPHRDYPVAWCREFGKGKVFYTSLGHREDVWTHSVYQTHLMGGILWALGIDASAGSATPGRPKAANDWTDLFDGKTLSGWKPTLDGTWEVKEGGVLRGSGNVGYLFSPKTYRNFHLRAEVRVFDDSNSGVYFRTLYEPDSSAPRGMEAQVNSSHGDMKRTGSLYAYKPEYRQLAAPEEWFRYDVIAVDEQIVIKVNGEVTASQRVPYDDKKHFPEGHFAFQQHHMGSIVEYRNVQVRQLP